MVNNESIMFVSVVLAGNNPRHSQPVLAMHQPCDSPEVSAIDVRLSKDYCV
jgi:hypothetical protein